MDDKVIVSTANSMFSKLGEFSFPEEKGYTDPTTFELLTLFAFLLFKEAGCRWAVIETGLGGRLDATNVVKPEMSIITPIELEHTAILGSTLEEIAGEKGGIIKPGIPVLCGFQRPEVSRTLEAIAESRNSSITLLEKEVSDLAFHTEMHGEIVRVSWENGQRTELNLRMRGGFQAENATLAYTCLKKLPVTLTDDQMRDALQSAVIPGRLEQVCINPPLFIDGAHTEQSIRKLFHSFSQMFPNGGILIFGSVTGKDHYAMAEIVLKNFSRIIISTPGTFKPSDPEALYRLFLELQESLGTHNTISLEKNPADALKAALAEASENQPETLPVLAAGSFYMAAEIRDCQTCTG